MKRPLSGILFLFVFIAPITLLIMISNHQKSIVRKQIKRRIINGIDKNDLVILKFRTEEVDHLLHWKHSKEFEYAGEMYDIVETEIRGDSTVYWCWLDHEETQLNKKLLTLVADYLKTDPSQQKTDSLISNYFKSLFLNDTLASFLVPEKPFNILYDMYAEKPINMLMQPFTPPPIS